MVSVPALRGEENMGMEDSEFENTELERTLVRLRDFDGEPRWRYWGKTRFRTASTVR